MRDLGSIPVALAMSFFSCSDNSGDEAFALLESTIVNNSSVMPSTSDGSRDAELLVPTPWLPPPVPVAEDDVPVPTPVPEPDIPVLVSMDTAYGFFWKTFFDAQAREQAPDRERKKVSG